MAVEAVLGQTDQRWRLHLDWFSLFQIPGVEDCCNIHLGN